MLLDRRCAACRRPPTTLCRHCRAGLVAALLRHDDPAPPPPPGIDHLTALFAYRGPVADVVLAAKNGGHRRLLRWFGSWLSLTLAEGEPAAFDVVTWVPASRSRRRRRGYDQGRDLARAVAHGLGLDAVNLLHRAGGEGQAGRSRHDRLRGPRLGVTGPVPPRVLVVDDVSTTGASLAAAATALRSGGAGGVAAAVVAVVVE